MTELTIDPELFAQIDLSAGAHSSPDSGMCLLEAVSYLAGEEFSDRPKCVSPVLGAFGRGLNDVLPDNLRQELKALIPSLPGTAYDDLDEQRGFMAIDWLIRTWLPTWLDLVPECREDAAKIRALGRIIDLGSAERAVPVVRAARANAAIGKSAAWAAVKAAAWAAVKATAWAAAWAAALSAPRSAAWATVPDTAWATVGDTAWATAWATAQDAAGVAAWTGNVLTSTVEGLHRSAIELFRDMIKDPS